MLNPAKSYLSVGIAYELRDALAATARNEGRSLSGQVRFILTSALLKNNKENAGATATKKGARHENA
ncbi:MAG: hypothetical protein LBR07_04445 [Puniceicoccales bacterium]|jgi:hypothetical protein|nr:hypothetical protein [Puniceicoccales bacterium]